MLSQCNNHNEYIQTLSKNTFTTCPHCGNTIYKSTSKKILSTLKPLSYSSPSLSPFSLSHSSFSSLSSLLHLLPQPTHITNISTFYCETRSSIITSLLKHSNVYDYSKSTFYLALAYLDKLLQNKHHLSPKTTELYVINALLLAAKFREVSIYEPNFSRFTCDNGEYQINEDEIQENEIDLLKELNYELNVITAYDVLQMLLYNGIVYDDEIDKENDNVNKIYEYAEELFKLLYNDINIIGFDVREVAISVVCLTRKYFNLKKNGFDLIKKFHKVHNWKGIYKESYSIMKKIVKENGWVRNVVEKKKGKVKERKAFRKGSSASSSGEDDVEKVI